LRKIPAPIDGECRRAARRLDDALQIAAIVNVRRATTRGFTAFMLENVERPSFLSNI
jgi:hypothetical protein